MTDEGDHSFPNCHQAFVSFLDFHHFVGNRWAMRERHDGNVKQGFSRLCFRLLNPQTSRKPNEYRALTDPLYLIFCSLCGNLKTGTKTNVKLINRGILHDFKQRHPDASSQVEAWEAEASDANWNMPSDIKKRYGAASFLKDSNVVFNIKGNKYRLRVRVSYKNQIVFILKAGTHTEYMAW